jgi:hypothetical protein
MIRGVLLAGSVALMLGSGALAERIAVNHTQRPMRRLMVTRSEDGRVIGTCEFQQVVQGNEGTIKLTYRFVDGSIDEETTTYTQQGKFQLVRDHYIEKGPFFSKPFDFAVEAATGVATSRTEDSHGEVHVTSKHIDLPDDLANGFIGTLLINVPPNTAPFRVGFLAPFGGGRLVQLLISPEGEKPFQEAGQTLKATVFRIHPELGGIVGIFAALFGLQPKDVMVWIHEGNEPEVIRMVGQLGGYGPVVSSELEGTSFGK